MFFSTSINGEDVAALDQDRSKAEFGDLKMIETPAPLTLKFNDAGLFASALTQADISCVQTSTGGVELELSILRLSGIELHFTSIPVGTCVALGKAAPGTKSFHIPLGDSSKLTIMGTKMTPRSFATYANGGEQAISAQTGAKLAYLVPAPEFYAAATHVHEGRGSRSSAGSGCEVSESDGADLGRLLRVLEDLARLIGDCPDAFTKPALVRHLESILAELLVTSTQAQERQPATGRTPLPRGRVVRAIDDYLRRMSSEPVFVSDLCAAAGISQPTLFRIFADVIGIGPKQYLQIRRLHLARKMLLESQPRRTVTDVAFDCGFWQLGRFGQAYRELFGESPAQTLRRARNTYQPPEVADHPA
ncbi:MAG: helix-turn-helix domain-containing protein [Hyphomonas sp.]|nr:helix-turn-helix domain-containing protein [Hyphomonas sp.]